MNTKDDEITRAILRLPKEIYERIRVLAKNNHRSINAQIVIVLKEWVENQEVKNSD